MDKIKKYQQAILSILQEYAQINPVNMKEVENQIIIDNQNHHYQLMRVGWDKDEFVHDSVMHFDIKDEKVWIQCNWTEIDVAEELLEKGVDRQDIVLGFIPVEERKYTGYAA
ncbi:MAG: XisI protein [Bacteroidia bacterium]